MGLESRHPTRSRALTGQKQSACHCTEVLVRTQFRGIFRADRARRGTFLTPVGRMPRRDHGSPSRAPAGSHSPQRRGSFEVHPGGWMARRTRLRVLGRKRGLEGARAWFRRSCLSRMKRLSSRHQANVSSKPTLEMETGMLMPWVCISSTSADRDAWPWRLSSWRAE